MGWPYHFVDLTDTQKFQRRDLLDRYGIYAQLSALVPILIYQLYRLAAWVNSERQRSKVSYTAVPSSPVLKKSRSSNSGLVVRKWRSLVWWLEGEGLEGWGSRGRWIAGGVWGTWLLFLCVHKTGDDYLHVTKRFGMIAASQLPLHFMLSMKTNYSPLAIAFRSSHEELNPWHRVSGRIIYFLLLLHGTWYFNFFIQSGILASRLKAPVVIIGIVGLAILTTILTTSLATVRHWSYRLFFIIHLIAGVGILPLLFFHATPLRLYTVECLTFFVFDLAVRKLDTYTSFTRITSVPNTNLIKMTVNIPSSKVSRFTAPGQHVYLSIPPESVPRTGFSPLVHELLFNPFTIASVSGRQLTLILRSLNGPVTTALESLSKLTKARPPINIEGPYGTSRKFPNLGVNFDRVLLVAGGVGATFTLPIYQHLRDQFESEGKSPDRVTFVWSLRSAAEAAWTLDLDWEKSVHEDENIKIYLTRNEVNTEYNDNEGGDGAGGRDGSVELEDLRTRNSVEGITANGGLERPDLKQIVDDVFMHGSEESVAVLVCGPKGMAGELRGYVGKWVRKGRHVWWHDESFGL